jgi:uncharacterized membrane protein YfhO
LPKAYFVKKAILASSKEEARNFIFADSFDPAKEVVVEDPVSFDEGGEGQVEMVKYEDNYIEMKVDAPEGGFLVLSDNNYPGWVAKVDGQEQKILQANYTFRALEIKPGQHSVTFSYEPKSVKYGQIISLATLGILILFGGFCWLKKL